ncbi:hypothetical protein AB9K35_04160 [Leisingera sp. XS_AS12]|uniref:hypothetical protein n=1 Tax=Leisingera sp. XS_AS12 TaxID=3241294 RepID=UPI003513E6B6
MVKHTLIAIAISALASTASSSEWVPRVVKHMHSLGYNMQTLEACAGVQEVDQSERLQIYQTHVKSAEQLCAASFNSNATVCQIHLDEGRRRAATSDKPYCQHVMRTGPNLPAQIQNTLTPVARPQGVPEKHWAKILRLTSMIEKMHFCPEHIGRPSERRASRRISHAIDDACDSVPNVRGVCGGAFTHAGQSLDVFFDGMTAAESGTYFAKECPALADEARELAEKMLEGLAVGEVYSPAKLNEYNRRDMFRAAYLHFNAFGDVAVSYENAVANYMLSTSCQYSDAVRWTEDEAEEVYDFWSSIAEDLLSEGKLTKHHIDKAHEEGDLNSQFLERGDKRLLRSECARIAIGIE